MSTGGPNEGGTFADYLDETDFHRLVDELDRHVLSIQRLPDREARYRLMDALNATAQDMIGDYWRDRAGQ